MKKVLLSILMTLTLIASGKELYKNCAGCHGQQGEISAMGKSKIITSQESNLTIKELTAYKDGELNQYGLGNIMLLQLKNISYEEIEELAQYIENMDNNLSTSEANLSL